MRDRMVAAAIVAALAFALVACAPAARAPIAPPETPVDSPADSPAAGMRLANGLYDLEDGTAQAVGTLEYRDLEGGFWAVVSGSSAEGSDIVAVIANGADFKARLESLEGSLVAVTGRRLDGASVRMAGPEIEMSAIVEMSDTPGIAE